MKKKITVNEYLATMDNSETIFLATFLVQFIVSNSGSASSSILPSPTGKLSDNPKLTFFHSSALSLYRLWGSQNMTNMLNHKSIIPNMFN